jgi:predicted dithiol-disulfide oxidoreductase (DUF899 family)
MSAHPVVSHQKWVHARKQLLAREKAFTHERDALSRERREFPWEKVEKQYVFDGPKGKETLADLFAGKSQLVVYHFMFGADWKEGCPACSFWADNFNGIITHLKQRDTTMVAISRAALPKLEAFKKRMGWSFKWLSSGDNGFNRDYDVAFTPEEVASENALYNYTMQNPLATEREGVSVFFKDPDGNVFHTYSAYARGIDLVNTAYNYLDLVPKGRDEDENGLPGWIRHHDKYKD